MSWVAVSPVILIDAGGMTSSPVRLVQVPVFGAVIVANMVVARFEKDPTNPRFIWRAVPIQLSGLFVLIAGTCSGLTCGCGRCWAPVCMRLALG